MNCDSKLYLLFKQIVLKKYGKTIISTYPNRSRIKPSKKQKVNRSACAEAVAYAKKIVRDPELKKQYLKKVKKGESVYHYALKEWFGKVK